MELFIYQTQGKTNELLKKYDEALELNPENTLFLYNRAATYDNITRDILNKAKSDKDTALKISGEIVGKSKFATAPIPAISATIFNIIAGTLNTSIKYKRILE